MDSNLYQCKNRSCSKKGFIHQVESSSASGSAPVCTNCMKPLAPVKKVQSNDSSQKT